MSDRAYANVQAQQKTLSGSSPKSSLLQRTCACGQHTLAGAECSTCRSEQSTLQGSQRAFEPPSAPGGVPGSSPAQENGPSFNSAFDRTSLFGHDFSQIPVYSSHPPMLQTKLTVNQPGDVYEREADQVAEQVMRMPKPQLQRACACGGGCPKCQTEQVVRMVSATSPNVQHQTMARAKAQPNLLEILVPNDQATPAPAPEAPIQPKLTIGNPAESLSLNQRQTESLDDQGDCSVAQPQLPKQEQDESRISSSLQRYPAHQSGFSQLPPIVKEMLNSPGQPLDPATSTFMESRFGHGFNQVRVHTDSRAAQLAQSLNAQAFTVGRDVVFGAGQYAPQAFEGKRLIAHELTHVLQQSDEKSVIRRKIRFNSPNYIRDNPIGRILSEQPIGLTTPTFNSTPLPANPRQASDPQQAKQLYNQAGQLILDALTPKAISHHPSTKECTFADFDVNVSANVIIPTAPEGNKWTMNFPGSSIKGTSACHDKRNVPVVMTGKPDSDSAGKWIESNEQEHVDDLKKLYDKYFEPHFKWLLSLKGKGDDDKKCQESLMNTLGNKDALVAHDFLKDWSDSIDKRDTGGKHTFHNDIKIKDNCSRVEIESSKK